MRKTLVAGAAMISGLLAWAPVATAQQQTQSTTTPPATPAPLPNLGASFGPTTATPGLAYWLNPPLATALQAANPFTPPAGSPPSIGQPYGATATAIPSYTNAPPLAPGNITVRLQGRITSYIGLAADSGRNPGLITLAPGAAPVAANTKLAVTLNSARRQAPNRQVVTLQSGTSSRSKPAPDHAAIRHLLRRVLGTHFRRSPLSRTTLA